MPSLNDQLISKQKLLQTQSVTIGFDGFVDTIVRLVKQKETEGQPAAYFNRMADWGNYILDKKAGNFSVELRKRSIKTGGNMPNMAAALTKLGVAVNCVGAMGYPVIDPLFSELPDACRLYSFAAPGDCQAIEFDDGKIMMAGMDELNKADWNTIKERIPIAGLIKIFDDARLVGMLNWGELVASTGFWNGLLQDVLPFCSARKDKLFFVDLSDCSSRTKEEMLAALTLLKAFAAYGKVILSVNHNESIFIHNSLFETITGYENGKAMGEKLFGQLHIDTLLLHNRSRAFAFRKDEFAEKDVFFIESPKLLTGAGDNFNAGFCFAQLMDCTLDDSLLLAHLVAAQYIKNGESVSWDGLLAALKTIII